MNDLLLGVGASALAAWIYLTFFHGRFWRADTLFETTALPAQPTGPWPSVAAVVPARNAADVLDETLGSLLDQDYPGAFHIVLVDDDSTDGTRDAALALGVTHQQGARLEVVSAPDALPDWVGMTEAGEPDAAAVQDGAPGHPLPDYLLLTDAEVRHDPESVRRLVQKCAGEDRDMVSLMVMRHCRRPWERLLIPALVYFFQQRRPFPRINDPRSKVAGAADGCTLVRRTAFQSADGAAIEDDWALGRALERTGPVWVGLTSKSERIRPYEGLPGIWNTSADSAYSELDYSPMRFVGTVVGLVLVYLMPPLFFVGGLVAGDAGAAFLGGASYALMWATFVPTLRLYELPVWRGLALPLAGALYIGMTIDSARRHLRDRHLQDKAARWRAGADAGTNAGPNAGDARA